ncbi:MAG: LPXTG cell wall anchor domain-containing protein, partial [Candidatus Acidiferrales bacterium]
HLYATILAIPNYRVTATDKTVVKFSETAAGAPNAVKEWFYPGHSNGVEFVYPKQRAVELAEASNEPVTSMPEEMGAEVTQPPQQAFENAPIKVEEPGGKEVEVAEAFPPASTRLTELPKTASDLPLIGLVGLLLASSGTILWAFSKRTSA